MKKILSMAILVMAISYLHGQELYVFTDPASNVPAGSISAKYSSKVLKSHHTDRIEQRMTPEIMLGLSKKWMVRGATTFSNMYSDKVKWESVRLYTKYRLVSIDEVHKHFRMALFAEGALTGRDVFYDELSLDGDNAGVQGGVVITQLWNKLAVSSSLSYLKELSEKPKVAGWKNPYPDQAFNYSLSAGYLLLPRSYTDYRQTNLNIYAELLGQQSIDKKRYYVDLAPAVQLIFNSTAKLNLGYRFQLDGDMSRMAKNSWMLSFEYVFLNALRKR